MTTATKIEWTDHTFNPWWGCEKVSPACDSCYAEAFSKRIGQQVWGHGAPRRFFGDAHWAEPLKWDQEAAAAGRPALVFCASMADVFEKRADLIPHRFRLWDLIESTPHLIWQLLTKRPEQVPYMVPGSWRIEWPSNVWLGTTVEDQQRARLRLPRLMAVEGVPVRFLSCEPLLSLVDLKHAIDPLAIGGRWNLSDLGWVICGGESGPRARPLDPSWARSLRDECTGAGVPFFFKQWGTWLPYEDAEPPFLEGQDGRWVDGHHLPADLGEHEPTKGWWWPAVEESPVYRRVGKARAGRLLDGRTWDEMPERVPA